MGWPRRRKEAQVQDLDRLMAADQLPTRPPTTAAVRRIVGTKQGTTEDWWDVTPGNTIAALRETLSSMQMNPEIGRATIKSHGEVRWVFVNDAYVVQAGDLIDFKTPTSGTPEETPEDNERAMRREARREARQDEKLLKELQQMRQRLDKMGSS